MGAVEKQRYNNEIKPFYTYSDYQKWDGRWELIEGEPIMMASPNKKHQRISGKIYKLFSDLLDSCQNCEVLIAPMDYVIDNINVVQPDAMIVCNDNEINFVKEPPKIIFEILSFSTSRRDRDTKFKLYQKAGVKYYCIVNPNFETIEVFKNENNSYESEALLNKDKKYEFDIDECKIEFDSKEIF